MLINYYKKFNGALDQNGDFNLNCISATYDSKYINEIPEATFTMCYSDEKEICEQIECGCYITCNVPNGTRQYFKIWNIDIDTETDEFTIFCRQDFYDNVFSYVMHNVEGVKDVYLLDTGNVNGQQALEKLLATHPHLKAHSDITKISRAKWVDKRIGEALLGNDDNSFINRWGGELYIDKFDIYMLNRIGHDNGVQISYGKNIAGVKVQIDFDTVVTKYIPRGYNGIKLEGRTPWVISPKFNDYAEPHESIIKFEDIKVKEKESDEEGYDTIEQAREEMVRRCMDLFEYEHVDEPTLNIEVKMEYIGDTEEYKELKQLEFVDKGDIIYCKHSLLKHNTKARCIRCTWDILTQKMLTVEIGNINKNYFAIQNGINNTVNNAFDNNGNLKSSNLSGIINSTQAKLIASRQADNKHTVATIVEDVNKNSDRYGSIATGSFGMQISNRQRSNGDWEYKDFIKGGHVFGDCIDKGTIGSNGTAINLETGYCVFNNGLIGNPNAHFSFNDLHLYGKNMNIWLKDGRINFGGDKINIGADCGCNINYSTINKCNIVNSNVSNSNLSNCNVGGTKLETIKSKVNELENKSSDTSVKIDNLQQTITTLQNKNAELEKQVKELKDEIGKHNLRLIKIENKLNIVNNI